MSIITYADLGQAYAVTVSGNYAYVVSGSGFDIVDISNPQSPTIVGFSNFYNVEGPPGVIVVGQYAYAGVNGGIEIFDVSNPAAPIVLGSYGAGEPGVFGQIAISGNYAYLPGAFNGLDIVDISNPTNPTHVSYFPGGYVGSVAVSGHFAYVGTWFSNPQIDVVDISNPQNPVLIGEYSGVGEPVKIQISGNYAYVADATNGFYILNIANPTDPTFVGGYNLGAEQYSDVQIVGNDAFVADSTDGQLIELDISNPATPKLIETINVGGQPFGFSISGGYAYVADFNGGFETVGINLSPAANQQPVVVSSIGGGNNGGTTLDVIVSGQYAYVADGAKGCAYLIPLTPAIPLRSVRSTTNPRGSTRTQLAYL